MNAQSSSKLTFNQASTKTEREVTIRARADKVIERLSARHEANEARLVAERFAKLSRSDHARPELKPSWAIDDRRAWQMRQAKYQVAREHHARIMKVNRVADRMINKENRQQRSKGELER